MARERKIVMVSVRLSAPLVERLDFAARNTELESVKNRSTALQAALEAWLTAQEKRFEELGFFTKKAR